MPNIDKTLLNAADSTGAGSAFNMHRDADYDVTKNSQKMNGQVTITDTGAATQITVAIEGTLDGTNWFTILVQDVTLAGGKCLLPNINLRQIRANLLTLTAGTAPTVTVILNTNFK